jgi:aminobenzoyl-glutamate utilization protein B
VLATSIAHKGAVAGTKAFVGAVVECFKNTSLVEEAKRAFEEELGGVEYKSMLPPEQKPPAELNRAIMDKFRPEMARHYLKEMPQFT